MCVCVCVCLISPCPPALPRVALASTQVGPSDGCGLCRKRGCAQAAARKRPRVAEGDDVRRPQSQGMFPIAERKKTHAQTRAQTSLAHSTWCCMPLFQVAHKQGRAPACSPDSFSLPLRAACCDDSWRIFGDVTRRCRQRSRGWRTACGSPLCSACPNT